MTNVVRGEDRQAFPQWLDGGVLAPESQDVEGDVTKPAVLLVLNCLRLLRRGCQDRLDVLLETHLQHLVGLVENQEPQPGQVKRLLLQVVDHPARRADDHVRPAAQGAQLNAVALTAIDRQHVQARNVVRVPAEGLGHLKGQFAFCVYDERKNVAFLARDRFGICPLYWTVRRRGETTYLLMALQMSEPPPPLVLPDGAGELHPQLEEILFRMLAKKPELEVNYAAERPGIAGGKVRLPEPPRKLNKQEAAIVR